MAAKNPAIKRIHADLRELNLHPSDQYIAAPVAGISSSPKDKALGNVQLMFLDSGAKQS